MLLGRDFRVSLFACGFAAAAGILLAASSVQATTYYWTTGASGNPPVAGNGTWAGSGAANWETSPAGSSLTSWVGGSSDTADFYASGTSTITVSGNQTVGAITFDGSGYTLAGGTLTLGNGSNGTVTVNQNAEIDSAIAVPSGPFIVQTTTGAGTLYITNAANSFPGGILLNGGTLVPGNNNALGTGTLTLSGGTLGFNASQTTLANNIVAAPGTTSGISFSGSLPPWQTGFTLSGNLTGSGTVNVSASPAQPAFGILPDASGFSGTISIDVSSSNFYPTVVNSGGAAAKWAVTGGSAGGYLYPGSFILRDHQHGGAQRQRQPHGGTRRNHHVVDRR